MPGFIGLPELLVLAVVVLLIFGPKRLPEMGKSLGKGLREFRDSVSGSDKDDAPTVTPVQTQQLPQEQASLPVVVNTPAEPASPPSEPVTVSTPPAETSTDAAAAPASDDRA